MKKALWTRGEKWAAAGTIVAIIGLLLVVFVPEVRTWLGLEKHFPSPTYGAGEHEPPAEHQIIASIEPNPKKTTKQSSRTKVSGNGNVAGYNTAGSAVGNGSQVASPTLVIPGSGNGISFGQQGGITAGTVNVSPPQASVTWEPIERDDLSKGQQHPRSFAKMYLNQSLPDARFAVICDRPCQVVWHSAVDGMNSAKPFSAPTVPNIAGFMVIQPNPFPAYTNYILGVESQDGIQAKILRVAVWNLTNEQKRALVQ
jgi:hypothetical protein